MHTTHPVPACYAPLAIEAVWATRLPPQPDSASGVLPDWAAPATLSPAGARWPENVTRYAVHVRDSAGVVGSYGPCSATVVQIIADQVAPALIGTSVAAWLEIERLPIDGRHTSGAHARLAVSAVELACWDLRSRASQVPVSALLGGAATGSVRAYAGCLGVDVDHSLAPDIARWVAETGFWAQKWRLPGWSRDEEPAVDARRLARLRESVGDEARIAVDGLRQWDVAYAKRMMPVLAANGVAWIEEPLQAPTAAVGASGVPVAGGEHLHDEADQLRALVDGGLDLWQPDLTWNGGLTVTHRLARVAALRGIGCLPHGSGVAAAIQLAAIEGPRVVLAVEYHLTLEPLRQAAAVNPLAPVCGVFDVADRPGLGPTFNHAADDQVLLGGGGISAR